MDIELMRRLSPRVNVIPVIGKSDTMTPTELRDFKKRVSHSILSLVSCLFLFLLLLRLSDDQGLSTNIAN